MYMRVCAATHTHRQTHTAGTLGTRARVHVHRGVKRRAAIKRVGRDAC